MVHIEGRKLGIRPLKTDSPKALASDIQMHSKQQRLLLGQEKNILDSIVPLRANLLGTGVFDTHIIGRS